MQKCAPLFVQYVQEGRLQEFFCPDSPVFLSDSRYTMQNGKCAISGITLSYSDIHCHHKIPFSISKDDSFKNLIIVHKDIHMLFHSNDINFINQELKKFRINKNKKEKFWELWKLCHN